MAACSELRNEFVRLWSPLGISLFMCFCAWFAIVWRCSRDVRYGSLLDNCAYNIWNVTSRGLHTRLHVVIARLDLQYLPPSSDRDMRKFSIRRVRARVRTYACKRVFTRARILLFLFLFMVFLLKEEWSGRLVGSLHTKEHITLCACTHCKPPYESLHGDDTESRESEHDVRKRIFPVVAQFERTHLATPLNPRHWWTVTWKHTRTIPRKIVFTWCLIGVQTFRRNTLKSTHWEIVKFYQRNYVYFRVDKCTCCWT